MFDDKFEVYKAKDGWRWRLVSRNGQVYAASQEAFTRKADAVRAAKTVRSKARLAFVKTVDDAYSQVEAE